MIKEDDGQAATIVLATILGIIVIAALAVGGWQLGWWLKSETVNRNTAIANESLARQQALRTDVIHKYDDIMNIDVQIAQAPEQAAVLNAQRKAEVTQLCDSYRQMTDRLNVDANIQTFTAKECK